MLQLDRIRLAAVAALLLCGAAHVAARTPDGRAHANIPPRPSMPVVVPPEGAPVTSRNGTTLPPYNTTYYFDQLIDHSNPSLGTFQQRYWHTYEFYEPGEFFHSGADAMEHSVLTGNGAFPPQVVRLSFPLREK